MAKYKVGDVVNIVDEEPDYCDAGWDRGMERYLGKEAEIKTTYSNGYYGIDLDHGSYYWSEDLFQESYPELKIEQSEIDSAMESLFAGFKRV